MSRWTDLAASTLELSKKMEQHEFDAAETKCTEYIAENANSVTDELIGTFILRSHCRAAQDNISGALNDHLTALNMIGETSGENLYEIANEAMNAGLPFEHCASVFYRAAETLSESAVRADCAEDTSYPSARLLASAYNKAGICHYKADSPVEQEIACYTCADNVISAVEAPDEDDLLLSALIKSNMAECHARNEDYIEAAELFRCAADIYEPRRSRSAVCTDQYAMCMRSLSDIHRATGENIEAHNRLSEAISALENHPDGASENALTQLASCHNSRGTLRYQIGDYEGEVEDCSVSIELRKGLPADHAALSTIYTNRAEAYEQLGDFPSAAEDYLCAISELEHIESQDPEVTGFIAMRLFSLAESYRQQEMLNEAMETFQKCAEKLVSIRSVEFQPVMRKQLGEAEAHCRLCMAQLALDEPFTNYHQAMTEANLSLSLFSELEPSSEYSFRISFLHSLLGEIYEMFDERESAAEEFRLSQEILEEALTDDDADEDEEVYDENDVWDDPSGTIPQA